MFIFRVSDVQGNLKELDQWVVNVAQNVEVVIDFSLTPCQTSLWSSWKQESRWNIITVLASSDEEKKKLSKKNYELEDWWNSSKSDSMQVGSEDEYL